MAVFERPDNLAYASGALLVGAYSETFESYPVGIRTERHALTIAGAGAGKGAAVIIPNLLKWPHNTLTIDPKGEAAEITAERREAMGFPVHVIDPFRSANIPTRFLASYNPLAALDPASVTIKEDIETISDGIIMRANPESAHWDDGAQAVLSGLIAYALLKLPPAKQNLIEVRAILRNRDRFAEAVETMQNLEGCAGLCEAGASAVYAKEGGYFVSNAESNTRWLDSEGMKNALEKSTFALSDLKRGKASVYLVLPANYLNQHGRFLRLFVRCSIDEMARRTPDGKLRGTQCLFLLDEFFALGYIDEISKAAGLMRGYGLQLWPILQDLGQLQKLYGREGAETFFGNSDIHQFFGNMDALTLDYISERIGAKDREIREEADEFVKTTDEENAPDWLDTREDRDMKVKMKIAGREGAIQYRRDNIGKPRMRPDEVANLIQKSGDGVARSCICFIQGMRRLNLSLVPYWKMDSDQYKWGEPVPRPDGAPPSTRQAEKTLFQRLRQKWWFWPAVVIAVLITVPLILN